MIGKGVVKPQGEKVCKILEISTPKTKKGLRSFLGAVGFYRKFDDRFAERAKPLTDMTRKGEPNVLKWSASADDCRNHYNCWWAIMLSWRYRDETLDHLRYSRGKYPLTKQPSCKQSTTHTFLLTCRYVSIVSWFSPEVTMVGRL